MDFWSRLLADPPFLDLTDFVLEFDCDQVERYYLPLAEKLLSLSEGLLTREKRRLYAIAGPPGSGKTAFAASLSSVINTLSGSPRSSVIGLDAWHFPNQYLNTHTFRKDGVELPLRRIKGSPESFDADSAYDTLAAIACSELSTFPVYSRSLHDPVPGAGYIPPEARIIFVEGNYLLLDEAAWRRFPALFDFRIFLEAPIPALEAALLERHQRFGRTQAAALEHLQRVDLPNALRVLTRRMPADLVIHKSDSRTIDRLEYLSG